MPTTEVLDSCFQSNKDGIGFSFNKTGEQPVIAKGYANVKKLVKMLDTYNVGKENNLLIHFRYATHGKKVPENCHPFPLTADYKEMEFLNCTCETAIAHNGIFSSMPTHDTRSDTMKFIGGILAQPEIIGNLHSKAVKELIKGYCGYSSKLAFLRPEGITTIGDFEEDKGIKYSNAQYKRWVYNNDRDVWDGKTYCYVHKCKDHCQYCTTHKEMDTCDYDKKNSCGSKAPIIYDSKGDQIFFTGKKCEWCLSTEDVRYDYNVQSNLCAECTIAWGGGDGRIASRFERDDY